MTARESREALLHYRWGPIPAPRITTETELAHWLNQAGSMAFLAGARHERIYAEIARALFPVVSARAEVLKSSEGEGCSDV